MAKYDLYNLPDDVLFLSKEDFNDLVVEICGKSEANLLKVQGIQNVQSLIRCMNIFSILDIDCDEVNNLNSIVCFQSQNMTNIKKRRNINRDRRYLIVQLFQQQIQLTLTLHSKQNRMKLQQVQ